MNNQHSSSCYVGFFLWEKMQKEGLVELGICGRPHGIKGGFQFKLYNPTESVLKKNSVITLFPKDATSSLKSEGEEFTISNIHFGNKVICYLKEINDRNLVEKMLPFSIFYPRDKFPKLADDEIYISDLLGLNIVNQQGVVIGKVENHYDNGAQTILKIKVNGKYEELPFIDNFFPKVDLENKTITYIAAEFEE